MSYHPCLWGTTVFTLTGKCLLIHWQLAACVQESQKRSEALRVPAATGLQRHGSGSALTVGFEDAHAVWTVWIPLHTASSGLNFLLPQPRTLLSLPLFALVCVLSCGHRSTNATPSDPRLVMVASGEQQNMEASASRLPTRSLGSKSPQPPALLA